MKNQLTRYKNWHLPSKLTFWSFVLSIIATPTVIITYFQYFGNDDIAGKLYKALQVNSRAYLNVKSSYIQSYHNDGKVLVLDIENISSFQAKNIKTKVLLSKDINLSGKLINNLGIPPKTTSSIVILPISQLIKNINKEFPKDKIYEIVDTPLLDKPSDKYGLGYSFLIQISYLTDGEENIYKTVAINAILKEKD